MEKNLKYTPTPWAIQPDIDLDGENTGHDIITADGKTVIATMGAGTIEEETADAAFIVRAANNLQRLIDLLQTRSVESHHHNNHPGNWKDCDSDVCEYDKAAISRAEARP